MRILAPFAAPLALALLLSSCAAQQPAPPPPAAQETPAARPAPPAFSEADILAALNTLINDTALATPEYDGRRQALAPALQTPGLDADLRRALAQALAFEPPLLRQRWQRHLQAQEDVATLYAANPPQDTSAMEGARILRRLGPALYLARLKDGDTVFFSTTRRHKAGARLKGVAALERPRPKPDKARGDLVDELADQPRTLVEITRQEARRRTALHAPVLAQLDKLEAEGEEHLRGVASDLARLDALTRDVNAALSPRLLPQAKCPAPASFVRKIKRLGRTYSREQYYRYALPVTGLPQVDAALKGHLDERRGEMLGLLRSTGIGPGRMRANVDRIAFTAHSASPTLLSVLFEEFRDTGGAHPNTTYASFVFDLRRQARLGLGEIFRDAPAALSVLSQLAARRMELVLDGTVFADGYEPKEENFSVFVLDGADIVFTFPPYQVASYAQGPQTLRVPLAHPRLLPLLTPEVLQALLGR